MYGPRPDNWGLWLRIPQKHHQPYMSVSISRPCRTPHRRWLILQTSTREKRLGRSGFVIKKWKSKCLLFRYSSVGSKTKEQVRPSHQSPKTKLVLNPRRQGDAEIFPQGCSLSILLAEGHFEHFLKNYLNFWFRSPYIIFIFYKNTIFL